MNLYDLKVLVDRATEQLERSHRSPSDISVQVKIFNPNAIGPSATTNIIAANLGIDWDSKKFILWPEQELETKKGKE